MIIRVTLLSQSAVVDRQTDMLDWGVCSLAHFDGVSYSSYENSCGVSPTSHHSVISWCVTAFIVRGGFGFCFFMVNIHGVVTEIGKYFCPHAVSPAPYVELTATTRKSTSARAAAQNNFHPAKESGHRGF